MRATLLILGLLFANLSLAQDKWEYCYFMHSHDFVTNTEIYAIDLPIQTPLAHDIAWMTKDGKHQINPEKPILGLKSANIDIDIRGKVSGFRVVNAIGQAGWELVNTQFHSTRPNNIKTTLETYHYWFKHKSK